MRDALSDLQRRSDTEPEDRARAHAAARALARVGDHRQAFERLFAAGFVDDRDSAPLLAELGAALAHQEALSRAVLGRLVEVETRPRSSSLRPDAASGPVLWLRFPGAASGIELEAIAGFRSLRSLIIERPCRIAEDELAIIAGCEQLMQLRLSGATLPRRARTLGELRRLKVLSLNATAIDDEALARVVLAAPLAQLNLGYVERSPAQRRIVAEARGLRFLSMVDCGLRGPDLAALGGLAELESLELSFNSLGDEGFEELGGLKKLTRLGLIHTGLGDAALPALARLEALEDLDLRGTRVSAEGALALRDLPALKSLGLPRAVEPATIYGAFESRGVQVRYGS